MSHHAKPRCGKPPGHAFGTVLVVLRRKLGVERVRERTRFSLGLWRARELNQQVVTARVRIGDKRELPRVEVRIEPAAGVAAPTGATARLLLAVLPLRNLSGHPAQECFSDGFTEELIAQLSRVEPALLGVTARGSAMKFKQSDKGAGQIGRQLGASYIVDGSVRRDQERVRISVQLIRVRDQSHLWAENYDRHLRDILDLQSEVARAVTAEITAKVSSTEQARRAGPRPIDPDAYNAYLQGRFFWNRRTPEAIKKAIDHFEQAVARDASYAPAHAGLADCYALLASIELGILPPIEAMPKAKNAARRAAELDPSLAEAHASLGFAALWFDWDWAAAEKELRRAIELNPAYPTARQWYAEYLATLDRMEDSVAHYRQALALDPLSPLLHTALGAEYYFERDYDRSIDESRRARRGSMSREMRCRSRRRGIARRGTSGSGATRARFCRGRALVRETAPRLAPLVSPCLPQAHR